MRQTRCETLASTHTKRLRALDAKNWAIRRRAFEELFRAGTQSVPTLIVGADHASPRVRAACISLMDHLADERCCGPLARALHDASALVRRHAVHAIGCQACKAHPLPIDVVGALIDRAMADPSIRVRRVAVHQLGLQPHDPRILAALTRTLADSKDAGIIRRARQALAQQARLG